MNFLSYYIPIVIIAFNTPGISQETPNPQNTEIIQNLLMYHISRHYDPITLRIIHYCDLEKTNSVNLFDSIPPYYPAVVGDVKPLIRSVEPRVISTGRKIGFEEAFRYVVLIYINDDASLYSLLDNLKETVNTRWDRVIIVAETMKQLRKIFNNKDKVIQTFKDKFLMSLDRPNSIWTDPLYYDQGKMIKINSLMDIPEKRKMGGMLRGRHLTVAGCEFKPWTYLEGDEFAKPPTVLGNHVDIVHAASEIFNYTYEFVYDYSYGAFWPHNQSWTGMYARVFYQEADFSIFLAKNSEWAYGVDFATTINTCELMFLTNQPRTVLHWYAFLLPFEIRVWIWIVISFVFLGIVQFFVMYFYHDRTIKYVVVDSAIFLPFAMAMEQGLCDIPKGARYLSLVWLLGCTVLGTGYRATLRQHMSFPKEQTIPITFEELAERPNYNIILLQIGSLERSYIEETKMPAFVNIRKRMSILYEVKECLKTVYKTGYSACMGWNAPMISASAGSLTVNTLVEPLAFSKNTPKLNIQSFAFQKDSIYVDSYCGVTEGVFESGLVGKWEHETNLKFKKERIAQLKIEKDPDEELYRLLVEQTKKGGADRKPLSMMNLWVIFTILPCGIVMSLMFFGLEHYIWNKEDVDAYLRANVKCLRKDKHIVVKSALAGKVRVHIEGKKIIVSESGDVKENHPPSVETKEPQVREQQDGEWYDPFGLLPNSVSKQDAIETAIKQRKGSSARLSAKRLLRWTSGKRV